jgi:hypothetical protein
MTMSYLTDLKAIKCSDYPAVIQDSSQPCLNSVDLKSNLVGIKISLQVGYVVDFVIDHSITFQALCKNAAALAPLSYQHV